jgi:general secretion pathway protein G
MNNEKHFQSRNSKGFTLVEMMAVVVIIGILAAFIAPKFFRQVDSAKITAAKTDIKKIEQAIQLYRMETGKIPERLRDLVRQPEELNGWNGPYMDKEPKDPWGNRYEYRFPGTDGREYDIICYGQDGREGGESSGADISNWEESED